MIVSIHSERVQYQSNTTWKTFTTNLPCCDLLLWRLPPRNATLPSKHESLKVPINLSGYACYLIIILNSRWLCRWPADTRDRHCHWTQIFFGRVRLTYYMHMNNSTKRLVQLELIEFVTANSLIVVWSSETCICKKNPHWSEISLMETFRCLSQRGD